MEARAVQVDQYKCIRDDGNAVFRPLITSRRQRKEHSIYGGVVPAMRFMRA